MALDWGLYSLEGVRITCTGLAGVGELAGERKGGNYAQVSMQQNAHKLIRTVQ